MRHLIDVWPADATIPEWGEFVRIDRGFQAGDEVVLVAGSEEHERVAVDVRPVPDLPGGDWVRVEFTRVPV